MGIKGDDARKLACDLLSTNSLWRCVQQSENCTPSNVNLSSGLQAQPHLNENKGEERVMG